MPDLVNVSYARNGQSISTNSMGMREMQARAFEARNAQYLLLKAPPASGKSRALMFLGLDKLFNQGLKKVIVAVPERIIGSSFDKAELTSHGFFADWDFNPEYNLCSPVGEASKVSTFQKFLNDSNATILICTHATLRFAFDAVDESAFDNTLLAIDEFHHVSADVDNRLDDVDDMDLIIALGMAKEGFDWPFCEHALTVGYRGSLTEIIQIIGRATRDSENKTHAQFTNLIAQPEAADDQVKLSVNNMLKAITASLLMEQVQTT